MSRATAERALAAAGTLGPFFAVDPLPGGAPPAGWHSGVDLASDPEALRGRVEGTRALLAAGGGSEPVPVDVRTAASLTGLGLAARMVSPVLGAALLSGVLPVIGPSAWLVGPPGRGPVAVAARPDAGRPWVTSEELAAALTEHCLEPVVLPVLSAIGAACAVPAGVLRGNAISAVAGAVQMARSRRPDVAAQATGAVLALLRSGPLAGTGDWRERDAGDARSPLTRRSCCLLYRLPGASLCGDCVLHLSPTRHRPPASRPDRRGRVGGGSPAG